jgi:hypothetical protein
MPLTAPAQFINLDLVLKSTSDLSEFVEHVDRQSFVLAHQEHDGEWILVLELADDAPPRDPAAHTQRFLTLMSGLPDEARAVWTACTSRTFSYGFDGGSNAPSLDATISAELLSQIAGLGAEIGITIYPFRQP